MKKLQQKSKLNNGGFSLVELIIVVAIMAVLIGVLAPQYLKYVENTRLQKDNQAVAEIANAIKIAMADEDIYNSIGASGESFTVNATHEYTFSTSGTALQKELNSAVGASVKMTSKTYSTTAPTITVTVDASNGTVKVQATNYIAKNGAAAGPQDF